MINRGIKFALMLMAGFTVLGISGVAFAQDGGVDTKAILAGEAGMIALAAGLCIGLAAFGGALGQSKAAAQALDGIARNPGAADKLFTPMILGLALIESLVIYALIISFLLLGKF